MNYYYWLSTKRIINNYIGTFITMLVGLKPCNPATFYHQPLDLTTTLQPCNLATL